MTGIALVILIIAAFAIPRLGKALLITGAVCAAIFIAFILVMSLTGSNDSEKRKHLISPTEIELADLQFRQDYGTKLTGKIKNKSSKFTLTNVDLKLTFTDCIAPANCEIVGETTADIYLSVPPGQIRYFEDSVYPSEMGPAHGERSWSYQISEIQGQS